MNLNKFTRVVGRQILKTKKQSPHILFGVGIIGVTASTVLACRATLKLSGTLDEINKDINDFKNLRTAIDEERTTYPEDQYSRELFYVHARSAFKVAKLYAPSVTIGVVSIAALSGSHVQLTRRNASLMAAYATVHAAFNEYRERIRLELGEERELDLYRGTTLEEVTDADGHKALVKSTNPSGHSMYSKIFDQFSEKYQKDPELNRIYLECQQKYANDILQARGHVLLNDVYDWLGLGRTSAGAVVGWVIGDQGDNYIDFGMYEAYNTPFINGWERAVVLDFNVDGVIYELI